MSTIKFLHAADLHLDSPMRGLVQYPGAPLEQMKNATRKALENLVALAIDQQVQFVLIAGDVYDGDWPDHNTGLFFANQMARLSNAEIKVFLISGNHDAASKITRSLGLPKNVVRLSHDRAQTVELPDAGVAIHGQGFAQQSVVDNLAQAYPPRRSGLFNIGMLHTCLEGREGHACYAPCSLDDLRGKGYDYWALGHVHQREEQTLDGAVAAFPGNAQGRHIREPGAKGCLVVTVGDDGRPALEFHPLDVARWEECRVDATGARDGEDLLERLHAALAAQIASADDRLLAVRVRVTGRSPLHYDLTGKLDEHTTEMRRVAAELGQERVWVEKIEWRTRPVQDAAASLPSGPLAELADLVSEAATDDALLAEFAAELDDLRIKVGSELDEVQDGPRPRDPAYIRAALVSAHALLTARLQGQEDAA